MSFIVSTIRIACSVLSSVLLGTDITTVACDTVAKGSSLCYGTSADPLRQLSLKVTNPRVSRIGMPVGIVASVPRSIFSLTGLHPILSKTFRVPILRFYGRGSSSDLSKAMVLRRPSRNAYSVSSTVRRGLRLCTDVVLYHRCWALTTFVPMDTIFQACRTVQIDNPFHVTGVIIYVCAPSASLLMASLQNLLPGISEARCLQVVLYSRCWDVVAYKAPCFAYVYAYIRQLISAVSRAPMLPFAIPQWSSPDITRSRRSVFMRRLAFGNIYLELSLSAWLPRALLALSPQPAEALHYDYIVALGWKVVYHNRSCRNLIESQPHTPHTKPAASASPPRPALRTPPRRQPLRQLILQQVQSNAKVTTHASRPIKIDPPVPAPPTPLTSQSVSAFSVSTVSPPPSPRRSTATSPPRPAATPMPFSTTASVASPDTPSTKPLGQSPSPATKALHTLQPNPTASFLGRQNQKPQSQPQQHKPQQRQPKVHSKRFIPPRLSPGRTTTLNFNPRPPTGSPFASNAPAPFVPPASHHYPNYKENAPLRYQTQPSQQYPPSTPRGQYTQHRQSLPFSGQGVAVERHGMSAHPVPFYSSDLPSPTQHPYTPTAYPCHAPPPSHIPQDHVPPAMPPQAYFGPSSPTSQPPSGNAHYFAPPPHYPRVV